MSKIPYTQSNGRLSVKVDLENASDVFLVDSFNFEKYQRGETFTYFGGHYRETPVTISVNGVGRWYLIVKGSRTYRYKFY